jgi:hypothetical protein
MTPPTLRKRKAAPFGSRLSMNLVTKEICLEEAVGASGERKHGGYFRVSEDAIRLIHRSFDKPAVTRAALLAYQTLCRVANLRGKTTFDARIASLGQDMAFTYRDAQRALELIEGIGLVKIQRRKVPGTKENAPSIYTLETLLPNATTSDQEAITLRESELHSTSPQLSQELPQKIHTYMQWEGGL